MSLFDDKKELQKIIEHYVSGTATPDEIRFVERYYQYLDQQPSPLEQENPEELAKMRYTNFQEIKSKINQEEQRKIIPLFKYIAAAAVLLLISGVAFIFINRTNIPRVKSDSTAVKNHDVLPGTDKAVLTLSDGKKVILDENTAANISSNNHIKIAKTGAGQIVYTILNNDDVKSNKVAFNTIQTPRGGQYQVVLPDGTKVWLNAASSLKYPEVFMGNTRTVELSGEAYFEVSKNKAMPFHVKSKFQDVEVLGTHFNINSYMDEQTIKTTLLEGSVKVSNLKSLKILKPSQQSIAGISENSLIKLASEVDTDDETAWKNGLFQFNNSDLKIILNQLERWYDIKIDYASIPAKRYNGMISRKVKLSEVLKMLEKTGNIKFEVTSVRKLKVLP